MARNADCIATQRRAARAASLPVAASTPKPPAFRDRMRRHPVVTGVAALVLLLFVVAAVALQGAFLRAPLERMLSEKTGHPVKIGKLEAGIQHGFTVRLRDVTVLPSTDGGTEPLTAELVVMRVRPRCRAAAYRTRSWLPRRLSLIYI